jgi:hypothetical protein
MQTLDSSLFLKPIWSNLLASHLLLEKTTKTLHIIFPEKTLFPKYFPSKVRFKEKP